MTTKPSALGAESASLPRRESRSAGAGADERGLMAMRDLADGFSRRWLWGAMAWQDVLQRYRGSLLGPFWLTLSTAIMISSMGVLYSTLFKMPMATYLPFLTLGLLAWNLISGLIVEGCQTFLVAENIIKQIKLPLSTHAFRLVWRSLIVAAHNFVVYVVIVFLFDVPLGPATLLVVPGILLVAANGIWVAILLGMLCARFRDIPQIAASLVQIAFFMTPIIWKPELLGPYEHLAHLNPFFAFVELIRAPLLGQAPHPTTWAIAVLVTLIGGGLTFAAFARFRSRIAYWV